MISKVFCKISVSSRLFQILGISNLAMVKDEKVSIKVTYIKQAKDNFSLFWREISYGEKGS
jgi:hypothetical protein